jgi:hypothetical protein
VDVLGMQFLRFWGGWSGVQIMWGLWTNNIVLRYQLVAIAIYLVMLPHLPVFNCAKPVNILIFQFILLEIVIAFHFNLF